MPKKILIILTFLLFLIPVIKSESVSAQVATPVDYPTCDLCGWCNRFVTPPDPSPPNWEECVQCIYEADEITPKTRAYYTVFGCFSTEPGEFVGSILQIAFSVVGGIAFVSVLFGSAMVLTSGGDLEKLQTGKHIITSSIIGLLLVIFSAFLLRVVGFDLLRIPGFG